MSKDQADQLPVSLYVHFPWCVRKCPYCDFNSHPVTNPIPEAEYLQCLLQDWEQQRPLLGDRKLISVFFGGGTPSLFQPAGFHQLIEAFRPSFAAEIELTMEANPGSLESGELAEYRQAGVNRLSLGVQSFNDRALANLGRIHSADDAHRAIAAARAGGFDNLNIDLMHGLPGQETQEAQADIRAAIRLGVDHISYYQLTIEPRTEFAQRPPVLPDDDKLAVIEDTGLALLADAGFERYEISAYARTNHRCIHNQNYWSFGDYLGIGAGAHGKISRGCGSQRSITRTTHPRQPRLYMNPQNIAAGPATQLVAPTEQAAEFMMNALRLIDGVPSSLFEQRTGVSMASINDPLKKWRDLGLMQPDHLGLTAKGLLALDTITADFLA